MFYRKKIFLIAALLSGFIILLTRCMNNPLKAAIDPRGKEYAGSASCRQCHQAIYDSFVNTAHANATSKPLAESIHGDFNAPKNSFSYNSMTKIVMEKRGADYYQVIYQNGKENGAYKFDVLFGYRHAQTSAYWSDDRFYELPLSYYASVNNWATSPNFPNDFVKLGRFVNRNCFDCHSSGIKIKKGSPLGAEPLLDKQTLVYGIDCERCHGPSAEHVNYHLQNPADKAAAFIIKNAALSKQQRLDACGLCHSGNDMLKLQSRFKFKMGDSLVRFFLYPPDKKEMDVHGNQMGLLQKSLCFKNGSNMTCATCHDPHKNTTNDLAAYSQKCMTCHKQETHNFCPRFASIGESIKNNCIDCHMPKKSSSAITFKLQGDAKELAYVLRTHRIAVYKESQ